MKEYEIVNGIKGSDTLFFLTHMLAVAVGAGLVFGLKACEHNHQYDKVLCKTTEFTTKIANDKIIYTPVKASTGIKRKFECSSTWMDKETYSKEEVLQTIEDGPK